MEAMAVGRPVIASNVAGCNNLVKDGYNGFLFENKNENDLHDKILKFKNLSFQEKEIMGVRGRQIIEKNFTVEIVINEYLKVLEMS